MKQSTLVVDDDTVFLNAVRDTLADDEVKGVKFLSSAKEAIEFAFSNKIDNLVVDWVFPGQDTSGIEVLRKVRERYPQARCVLITGHELGESELGQLRELKCEIVHKANLNRRVVLDLLVGGVDERQRDQLSSAPMDVGALRLKLEELQNRAFISAQRKLRDENDQVDTATEAARFRSNLGATFDQVCDSLMIEPENLRRLNRIARAAVVASLLFLFGCVGLMIAGQMTKGAVSLALAILSQIVGRFVFDREDKARKAMSEQMKDQSSVHSTLLLFAFCDTIVDDDARDTAIAELVSHLSKRRSGDSSDGDMNTPAGT